MKTSTANTASVIALLFIPLLLTATELLHDFNLPQQYGQTPWTSIHRDSRNSDHSSLLTSAVLQKSWSVLDGAALINPGVIARNNNHYVTSGRGKGYSHLHAFDKDGNLLWESKKQTSLDELDAFAGFNSPVIDKDGDLYIGDSNQLWAFHANGKLKWVSSLPDEGQPFVYQIISRQGYVGGITVTGQVLLYRREDGKLAVPAFRLPAGVAPDSGPWLPGLWHGGLLDKAVITLFQQIAFGYGVQVANAPAVHPVTGRIFITAAGEKEAGNYTGRLYGLDVTDNGIEIAFTSRMGGGSGTSPALSNDSSVVYSADGDGQMLAIATDDGAVRWKAKGEGLLSPAIGADDTIYTGNIFASPTVIALDPSDGTTRWARSYDDYAIARLPVLAPAPPAFPSGTPVARLVSVISVSANHVWVGMNLGYEYHAGDSGLALTVPHKTVICALRPGNGDLLSCTEVRDTVEGIINIGRAGRITVSHTSIFGSAFYHGLNQYLPLTYRSPVKPTGGMTVLKPKFICRQAEMEIDRSRRLIDQAMTKPGSPGYNRAEVLSRLNTARLQLRSNQYTLDEWVRAGDLSDDFLAQLRSSTGAVLEILNSLLSTSDLTNAGALLGDIELKTAQSLCSVSVTGENIPDI